MIVMEMEMGSSGQRGFGQVWSQADGGEGAQCLPASLD